MIFRKGQIGLLNLEIYHFDMPITNAFVWMLEIGTKHRIIKKIDDFCRTIR